MFWNRNLTLRKKNKSEYWKGKEYHSKLPPTNNREISTDQEFHLFSLFPSFSRGEGEVIDTKLF